MILLIDNYDSFSYNLYQMIGEFSSSIQVIRNDEMTIKQIDELHPDCIILSPGPGKPSQAGICEEVVHFFSGRIPILGVCLGHQAICEAYGGTVTYAKQLMHGKKSMIKINEKSRIFRELPSTIEVGRYHSLAALRDTLPDELEVIAETKDGEVMGVRIRSTDVYGLQFHPESILTKEGKKMIQNFLSLTR